MHAGKAATISQKLLAVCCSSSEAWAKVSSSTARAGSIPAWHRHRASLKVSVSAASMHQGLPVGLLNMKKIFSKVVFLCGWNMLQPPASLPLLISTQARVPPVCTMLHGIGLPRTPVSAGYPRCHGPAVQLLLHTAVIACRLPTVAMFGFQVNWLWHAFEPFSRITSSRFECSPPNAVNTATNFHLLLYFRICRIT